MVDSGVEKSSDFLFAIYMKYQFSEFRPAPQNLENEYIKINTFKKEKAKAKSPPSSSQRLKRGSTLTKKRSDLGVADKRKITAMPSKHDLPSSNLNLPLYTKESFTI